VFSPFYEASAFFFEKKNQKTFITWLGPIGESLFASFSSKKEGLPS
jgi:hypothetical protein